MDVYNWLTGNQIFYMIFKLLDCEVHKNRGHGQLSWFLCFFPQPSTVGPHIKCLAKNCEMNVFWRELASGPLTLRELILLGCLSDSVG